LEIEQTIAPFENFTLSGYFSWVKAIFSTDYLLNGLNVDNRQLPYTPTFKYGAYGTYTVPLAGELGKLAFSASWSHQDHVMTLDNLDPMDYFKGYDLVNVRADWSGVYNKPLDLALVVNNAANSTYVSGGYPLYSQVGFQSRIYGEPRMIYGQVTVHWGPNAKW